jgi:hypothetical protein
MTCNEARTDKEREIMTTNGNGNGSPTKYGKTILEERREKTPKAVSVLEKVCEKLGLEFYDQETKKTGIRSVDTYLVIAGLGEQHKYPNGAEQLLWDVLYTTKKTWGDGYEAHTESVAKALSSYLLEYFNAYGMRLDLDEAAERLSRAGSFEEYQAVVKTLDIKDKSEKHMFAMNQYLAPDFRRVVAGKKLEHDIASGLDHQASPFSRNVMHLVPAVL